jgi:hypothetical protein
MKLLAEIYPEVRSERGPPNVAYELRARSLVVDVLTEYPELRWLIDPERAQTGEEQAYRRTILSALGRIGVVVNA